MKFENYTKKNQVQKTIRFELRPVGDSLINLERSGLLNRDRELSKNYPIVKKMIDRYHRGFIESCLQGYQTDWNGLAEAIANNRKKDEVNHEKNRKELDRIKQDYRDSICARFKADPRFKKINSEKLFSKLMKDEVERDATEEQKEAFYSFNRFSGYFIGFHENRMNMYDSGSKSTAIAYRIVDQNFPKYLQNIQSLEYISANCPAVLEKARKEIGDDIDGYMDINGFNKLLNQKGIDRYNEIIGGVAISEKEHILGLNQILNEYRQHDSNSKRILLQPLYKFILSESITNSFVPSIFTSDEEVCKSVAGYVQQLSEPKEMLDGTDLLHGISGLFKELMNGRFNLDGIFVSSAALPRISSCLYGQWDTLDRNLRSYYADRLNDPLMKKTSKKIEKLIAAKHFRLSEIVAAVEHDDPTKDWGLYVNNLSKKAEDAYSGLSEVKLLINVKNVRTEEGSSAIRRILEPLIDLVRDMKVFSISSEDGRDESFYQEFDYEYDELFSVIRLYNKVRNYCTKKEYNTDKMKMNFGNPTLANGWSVSKERDNTCVLFRKDGNYYLGVMDPSKKVDFTKIAQSSSSDCYEKMDYRYLADPVKMLPKVFLSSDKWKANHEIPKDILDTYELKRNGKIDKYSVDFEKALIGYYQDSISQYEEWKSFDFKFKKPNEYDSLNEFYDSLTRQGYKVSFRPIDSKMIDDLVKEGRLFLFQLYNKDFSPNSTARTRPQSANLHTIYWNALFSDENLRETVIKLNGEAELFYRKKSDMDIRSHKKGEIIIRRTDGSGNPIPEDIFAELFRYVTHPGTKLSKEAEPYLEMAKPRPAPHEIVKDKRYTVDKMFMHVSLTFNYANQGTTKSQMDQAILQDAAESEEKYIIGIDRGERNLIYVCLIDGKGRIIRQKSMNVLGGFDYRTKLDDRERGRLDDRRNWNAVRNISNLKEGYISKAVHEIVMMAVEYNALIVMEDLNFGFKRGRFKIEKQVYQKFESMLLDKLSHLVFKGRSPTEPGGVLNAYQLSPPFESFTKLGRQSGIVLYVPAAYTSKIDPVTGFADVFNRGSETVANKREFLKNMTSIEYDPSLGCFTFTFDYRKYQTRQTMSHNIWSVSTIGDRIVYSRKDRAYSVLSPTNIIQEVLSSEGVRPEGNLKQTIISNDNLLKEVYRAFDLSLRMRNSDNERDFIISPVRSGGRFYCSDDYSGEDAPLPIDADANGAYNIARKGLLYLSLCVEKGNYSSGSVKMSNDDWFRFVQEED